MLCFTWTLQWSLLNVQIWTFNWVWHEHCNGLFNIRNLVSTLILMFVRICLCDTILYTWFGKKWKRLKKFWGWKIWLVYAYFFKHLSLSMLIRFMLIKKWVYSVMTCLCKLSCFSEMVSNISIINIINNLINIININNKYSIIYNIY